MTGPLPPVATPHRNQPDDSWLTGIPFGGMALGLGAGLFLSLVAAWMAPLLVTPSPLPFVEAVVSDLRTSNWEGVHKRLTPHWQNTLPLAKYVEENLKDEQDFVRLGGIISDLWVEGTAATWTRTEAYVPIWYRMKMLRHQPPKVQVRRVILKCVFRQGRWWLDGLKIFEP